MKRIGIWMLAFSLALTLVACGTAETPTQTTREPEAVTEEQQPKESAAETAAAETPEVQTEEAVPEEKIEQKLLAVSICPCMAQEHAQWELARWGYDAYDGEPINSQLVTFRTYLTEHYGELTQSYGELLDSTVWILDTDGTYAYLQIIGIDADSARQLVMLRLDRDNVEASEGTKPLEGYVTAPCAEGDKETEEYQAAVKKNDLLYVEKADVLFTRVCTLRDGFYIKNCFMRREEDTTDEIRIQTMDDYIYGILEFVIPLHSVPQSEAPELTPELETILKKIDLSQVSFVDDGNDYVKTILQYYLLRNWDDKIEPEWDDPIYASRYIGYGTALYGFQNLANEMELNPEFKQCLESMPKWEFVDFNEQTSEFRGTSDQNQTVSVKLSYTFVLADGFQTSYQKKLRELADNGENSSQIPEEIKQEFLDFLPDAVFGYDSLSCELGGNSLGTAAWKWTAEDNGNILLESLYTPDNPISSPSTIYFERNTGGEIKQVFRNTDNE